MSRSPERLAAAAAFTALLLAATPAWAEPQPGPVESLIAPVEDLVGEVESMDGSQSESKQGQTVTVALTSDVLFALDKYTLTAKAKHRLRTVAEKVTAEWTGGPIRINGHTDDQGADDYNLQLSLRRARAVQQALREALSGPPVTFEAKGYGEAKRKLPNIIDAKPIDANRARNRRVEIVFSAKE